MYYLQKLQYMRFFCDYKANKGNFQKHHKLDVVEFSCCQINFDVLSSNSTNNSYTFKFRTRIQVTKIFNDNRDIKKDLHIKDVETQQQRMGDLVNLGDQQ